MKLTIPICSGDFTEIMDNEITLAFDHRERQGDSAQVFVLMRVKSQGLAEEKMKDLLAEMPQR